MDFKMVDITLHIDEEINSDTRELLRDELLKQDGVMSADNHSKASHLFIVLYDPDIVKSYSFLDVVAKQGLHAELIGL